MPDKFSDGDLLEASHRSLWDLQEGLIYLNHGAFGACPTRVLKAQNRFRDRLESYPVQFFESVYPQAAQIARETLADFLNGTPDNIGFVRNTTTGVNAVLRSLEFFAGDEIVVTDHGYPACQNTVNFIADRTGAKVVVVSIPVPTSGPEIVAERIIEAFNDKTRLVLVDHVTSHTALILPVDQIVSAARDRGIEVLVDGAHAPGMLPLDLIELNAHYYTGNCHKWLCAPKGSAFLHVHDECKDKIHPVSISLGAGSPLQGQSRFRLEFDWQGTDDVTPYLSVPAAIQLLGSSVMGGWPELMKKNRGLALRARDLICGQLNLQKPCPDEMVGSIAVINIPGTLDLGDRSPFEPHPWQKALRERHNIEVPINVWQKPSGTMVRISAQLYNGIEQYQLLADALAELLASSDFAR